MDFSSSEISSTVFKRIVRDDIGEFPLDHQMLAVFMELDMSTMREIIAKLMQNGLVEKVDKEIVILDKDFFDYLVSHLSLALGPIAQVLIEDEIHDLGLEISRFPGSIPRASCG
jgi:site-specific recombinase XerC